ncbi:hypothetical protein [Nostoc sp. DedQUE09]|nr:hypothetical protein [Nostoc sp. DedQUE09]MDZ7953136.1 hypothetical protein [Nostoc sp. DedQUE09]
MGYANAFTLNLLFILYCQQLAIGMKSAEFQVLLAEAGRLARAELKDCL